jgi:3-dehydroquinate dehydratase-2
MHIVIINGPNLNLLGKRETSVYGSTSFEDFMVQLVKTYPQVQFTLEQSNVEGEIINVLHRYGLKDSPQKAHVIIINPGGYSHTSVAIADAIAAIHIPVIEVHISNIHAREEYRHHTLTGARCMGIISGFGLQSYAMAVEYVLSNLKP